MKKKILLFFMFLCIGLFAETTGYKLLTIDTNKYYKTDSSEAKIYENLVNKLDKVCVENEIQIGDMTVKAREIVEKKQVKL